MKTFEITTEPSERKIASVFMSFNMEGGFAELREINYLLNEVDHQQRYFKSLK